MRVRVRYFAQLRERLGDGSDQELRAGATVASVWDAVLADHPKLKTVPVRFAVNERYVKPGQRLADGDELAVFPPVSGGSHP